MIASVSADKKNKRRFRPIGRLPSTPPPGIPGPYGPCPGGREPVPCAIEIAGSGLLYVVRSDLREGRADLRAVSATTVLGLVVGVAGCGSPHSASIYIKASNAAEDARFGGAVALEKAAR